MKSPLTYWPCAGDVIASGGRVIGTHEANLLRRQYEEAGGDTASALAAELSQALAAAARWRNAADVHR